MDSSTTSVENLNSNEGKSTNDGTENGEKNENQSVIDSSGGNTNTQNESVSAIQRSNSPLLESSRGSRYLEELDSIAQEFSQMTALVPEDEPPVLITRESEVRHALSMQEDLNRRRSSREMNVDITANDQSPKHISFGKSPQIDEHSRPRPKRDPTPFVARTYSDEESEHSYSGTESYGPSSKDSLPDSTLPNSKVPEENGDMQSSGGNEIGSSSSLSRAEDEGMGKRTITFGKNMVKEFEADLELLSRQTSLRSSFSRESSVGHGANMKIIEEELTPLDDFDSGTFLRENLRSESSGSESGQHSRRVNFDPDNARGRNGRSNDRIRKRDPTPFVSRSFLPEDDDDEEEQQDARSRGSDDHVHFEDSAKPDARKGGRKRDPTPFVRGFKSCASEDEEDEDDSDRRREVPFTIAKEEHVHFVEPPELEVKAARKESAKAATRSSRNRDPTPFVPRSVGNSLPEDDELDSEDTSGNTHYEPPVQAHVGSATDTEARRILRPPYSGIKHALPEIDPIKTDVPVFIAFDHSYVQVTSLFVASIFFVDGLGMCVDPDMPSELYGRALWVNCGRQQLRLVLAGPNKCKTTTVFGLVVPSLSEFRRRIQAASVLFSPDSSFLVDFSSADDVHVTCPWGNLFKVREGNDSRGLTGIETVELVVASGTLAGISSFYRNSVGAVVFTDYDTGRLVVRIGPNQSIVFCESRTTPKPQDVTVCVYSPEFSTLYRLLCEMSLVDGINSQRTEFLFRQPAIANSTKLSLSFKVRSLLHPGFLRSRRSAPTAYSAFQSSRSELGFGDLEENEMSSARFDVAKPDTILNFAESPMKESQIASRRGISFGGISVKEFTSTPTALSSASSLRTASRLSIGSLDSLETHGGDFTSSASPESSEYHSFGGNNGVKEESPTNSGRGRRGREVDGSSNTAHVQINEPSEEELSVARRESGRVGIRSFRKRDPTPFVPRSFYNADDDEDQPNEQQSERGRGGR
mmetsp:Transcript_4546/g.7957  ORF Transcript_4546/g.7957 Transcript_4546/m.7957 type:complete len:980 (-) Transcript_4546:1202-4141(-)